MNDDTEHNPSSDPSTIAVTAADSSRADRSDGGCTEASPASPSCPRRILPQARPDWWEDLAVRAPSGRKCRRRAGPNGSNLAHKLRRFLRRQAGRSWSEVWPELKARLAGSDDGVVARLRAERLLLDELQPAPGGHDAGFTDRVRIDPATGLLTVADGRCRPAAVRSFTAAELIRQPVLPLTGLMPGRFAFWPPLREGEDERDRMLSIARAGRRDPLRNPTRRSDGRRERRRRRHEGHVRRSGSDPAVGMGARSPVAPVAGTVENAVGPRGIEAAFARIGARVRFGAAVAGVADDPDGGRCFVLDADAAIGDRWRIGGVDARRGALMLLLSMQGRVPRPPARSLQHPPDEWSGWPAGVIQFLCLRDGGDLIVAEYEPLDKWWQRRQRVRPERRRSFRAATGPVGLGPWRFVPVEDVSGDPPTRDHGRFALRCSPSHHPLIATEMCRGGGRPAWVHPGEGRGTRLMDDEASRRAGRDPLNPRHDRTWRKVWVGRRLLVRGTVRMGGHDAVELPGWHTVEPAGGAARDGLKRSLVDCRQP